LSSVISAIHSALAVVFDWLWKPLAFMSPGCQLIIVSVVFGLIMVVLFGKVSNQGAIRRVKEQIGAALLEVVLFRRDLSISLKAQASLLVGGIKYFLLAMGPVLILAIPFALILGHINLRLGSRPFAVGEEGILAVSVARGTDLRSIELQTPFGIDVVGPVRIPKSSSLFWKLSPHRSEPFKFVVKGPSGSVEENLVLNPEMSTSPAGIYLSTDDWLSQMLFPNDGPSQRITSAPFQSIELTYPQRVYSFLGIEMSWLTAFLVISIVAGYFGSRVLGISV
jgi:hypothetical protein